MDTKQGLKIFPSIKRLYHYLKNEGFKKLFKIILSINFLTFLIAVGTLGGTVVNSWTLSLLQKDYQTNLSDKSASYILRFDELLNSGTNLKVRKAIANNKNPLMSENGGKFSIDDIDGYLGVFEEMDSAYRAHLISTEMLYNSFSYDIIQAADNSDIRQYFTEITDPDDIPPNNDPMNYGLYAGFKHLYKVVLKINCTICKPYDL